jgi:predicted small lipoprotein YifL
MSAVRRHARLLAVAGALACAGCGAEGPQLPTPQADRTAAALTGIAEACGEAYQHDRFSGRDGAGRAAIQAQARMRAHELAETFAGNAQRVYQAQTMVQVVAQAVAYLRGCGLPAAASALRRETAR